MSEKADEASRLEDEGVVDTSDDALSRAADGALDEGLDEEEGELDGVGEGEEEAGGDEGGEGDKKPEKDEPDDNAERSRLGRKVKEQEQLLQTILLELQSLKKPAAEPVEEEEDDEALAEEARLEKLLERIQQKKEAKKTSYESKYLATLHTITKDVDEAEHKAIVEIMLSKYNKVITENPEVDAELNYRKAEADYLRSGVGKRKAPLRGDKPPKVEIPESKKKGAEALDVELDDFAKEFVAKTKMSTDSIKKALKK